MYNAHACTGAHTAAYQTHMYFRNLEFIVIFPNPINSHRVFLLPSLTPYLYDLLLSENPNSQELHIYSFVRFIINLKLYQNYFMQSITKIKPT